MSVSPDAHPLGRLAPWTRRAQTEQPAASTPHPIGPALRRDGLAFTRVVAGVTDADGKITEVYQAAAQRAERWMVNPQQAKKVVQVVRSRDVLAQFFQQSFQILFRRLLTMKTELVMKRFGTLGDLNDEPVIVFRFSYPGARRPLHKELYLCR